MESRYHLCHLPTVLMTLACICHTSVLLHSLYLYYSYPYIYMPPVSILAILFAEILHKVEHPVYLCGPLTVMGGLQLGIEIFGGLFLRLLYR